MLQTVAELIRISAEQRSLAVHQLHRFSASRQTCTDLSKCAFRVQRSYLLCLPLQPERLSAHLVSSLQDFVKLYVCCSLDSVFIRADACGACRMSVRSEGSMPLSVPAEAGPVGSVLDQVARNGMSSSTTLPMNGMAAGVLREKQPACLCIFSVASIVCAALMLVASFWTWSYSGSNNHNACSVNQSVVLQRGFPGRAGI